MSTQQPNKNIWIDRLELIMSKSALLLPKTNGTEKKNLVQQIIKYKFPIPESPPEGLGPPHLYITAPDDWIKQRQQIGRDSRNEQGAENVFIELYLIILAQSNTAIESQAQIYDIANAIENTIKTNKRLAIPETFADPFSFSTQLVQTPYLLDTEASNMIALNVVVRPQTLVNQRTT